MAENRKPRELEERTQDMRPQQWQQPELLPEPDKQPGYNFPQNCVRAGNQSRWKSNQSLDC
jgi:hypothetical protein